MHLSVPIFFFLPTPSLPLLSLLSPPSSLAHPPLFRQIPTVATSLLHIRAIRNFLQSGVVVAHRSQLRRRNCPRLIWCHCRRPLNFLPPRRRFFTGTGRCDLLLPPLGRRYHRQILTLPSPVTRRLWPSSSSSLSSSLSRSHNA